MLERGFRSRPSHPYGPLRTSKVLKVPQRFSKILHTQTYRHTKNSFYFIEILTVPWVTPSISKSLYIFSINPFGVPTAYLTRYHFMCIIALLRLIRDFKYLEGVESTITAHLFSYQPQETTKTMTPSL